MVIGAIEGAMMASDYFQDLHRTALCTKITAACDDTAVLYPAV
jgi:hypothetical protein